MPCAASAAKSSAQRPAEAQTVRRQQQGRLRRLLLRKGRIRGPGGLAPKTIENVHRMLRRALRDAVRWDYLPRNPAEQAEVPRGRRAQLVVWTPEQLGAFLRHVRNDRFYAL